MGFGGEDGTGTCQKAFSVARSREGYKVRAFYAAPALALEEGGVLDREAASRGVTLRLPDQEIPLLPPAVEQKVRLSAAEARPALCLEISLDADLRIRRCKLRLRRVKPTVVPASEIPASLGKRPISLRSLRKTAYVCTHTHINTHTHMYLHI